MADYYGTDTVVSELREDGLLIIRINRPEVANALNGATSDAMENIMNHAEKDKAVRAIIVTGTGKVFCAGEDLSELSEGGECQTVTEHGFGGITARLCSKPIIAACNGSAAGGGMEIALRGASGAACRFYSRPSVSAKPSMMFMFWTAAPDAPFPKLSNRAVTVKDSSFPATTICRSFCPALALAYSFAAGSSAGSGATWTICCPA